MPLVLRGSLGYGPKHPGDVEAVTDLVINSQGRDLALDLEQGAHLADQCQLVGLLNLELPKNGFWVCGASPWTNRTSRFSSPSNFLSIANSWF